MLPRLPLLVLLALVACNGTDAPPAGLPADDDRAVVLATLDSLPDQTFRAAFQHLSSISHTRRTRTEQLGADGQVLASIERVIHYDAQTGTPTLLRVDSSGAFHFGYLTPFASTDPITLDAADLADALLPEDPPYLTPRNREAFTYQILPDTAWGTGTARVLDIRLRPGDDMEQDIRHARYYLDDPSGQLLGIRLSRTKQMLLFREETHQAAIIRRLAGTTYVPATLTTSTRLNVPLRPLQHFRTTTTFAYDEMETVVSDDA